MGKNNQKEKGQNRGLKNEGFEIIGNQALCTCSNGSKPAYLNVVNQEKFFCNGATRLIATNGDKDTRSLNFGNCKARNNSPCVAIIQWNSFYDKILIGQSLCPLTMKSEGTCVCGGKITFRTSGQQIVVSPPASMLEAGQVVYSHLLFEKEDIKSMAKGEPTKGDGDLKQFSKNASVNRVRVNNTINVSLRVHDSEKLFFTYTLTRDADPSTAVKWDVTLNGKDMVIGLSEPPSRSFFTEKGEYKVFAYVQKRGSKEGGGYVTVTVSEPKLVSMEWKDANGKTARYTGSRHVVYAHVRFEGARNIPVKARFYYRRMDGKRYFTDFVPLRMEQDGTARAELSLSEAQAEEIKATPTEKPLIYMELVSEGWIENLMQAEKTPIEYTGKEEITGIAFCRDKECKEAVTGFVESGQAIYARLTTCGLNDDNVALFVYRHGMVTEEETSVNGGVYKVSGETDSHGIAILEIQTDTSWLKEKQSETFDVFVLEGGSKETAVIMPNGRTSTDRNTTKLFQVGKDKGILLLALPKQEIEAGQSKTMVQEVTNSGCGGKYCIRKGESSKLIEEINIRLAGFGGCLPSDKFTDLTETCVRQFQRDYMHVEETGIICGNFLNALDEFGKKYPININEAKCKCGRCKGFGNERYLSEYNNPRIQEKDRRYEYPGIHRSLFWAVKAVMFYLSNKEKEMNYSLQCIFSGYRCHYDNKIHRRSSTNHMGKALDLHFYRTTDKKKSWLYSTKDNETIRANIFRKYLNAKFDWQGKNVFNLESTSKGASSWVHFDVREYSLEYLDKRFFASTIKEVDGVSIVELAKANGKLGTCTCLSSMWQVNTPASPSVVRKKEYDLIDANDALNYIFKKYGREMACIIEKLYRLETTHFTTKQYKKCGAPGMEVHGNSPYYGWDKTFFQNNPEYKPIGVWAAYEGKGLSGVGGNKQVTDKKKQFVIMPSVKAGMEYLVYYIKKHNNNYARWYSLKEDHQRLYRQRVQSIKSRIVNKIK